MIDTQEAVRGYQIIILREALGLDQAAFARQIGVSERTMRSWETGSVIPASAQFMLRLIIHCAALPVERGQDGRAVSGQAGPLVEWIDQTDQLLGRKGAGNGN